MPEGFKGRNIQVSGIELRGRGSGPVLRADLQFASGEGVVHAITHHEIEPGVTPQIQAATKALIEAITEWAETVHFDKASPKKAEKFRGIAESFSGSPDPADDSEEQG